MAGFATLTITCLVVLGILQAVTCAAALRQHRFRLVDQVWGVGFAGVAILAAVVGHGDLPRRILLGVLVTTWGLRLSLHIARRSRGKAEDPRYAELVTGRSTAIACLKVFGIQWVAQWFVSMPIQVAATSGPPGCWTLVVVGAIVSLGGMTFEATADRQLVRFKADPSNDGRIMDSGLWAWSRHPNYFGDALMWVGIYLIAAAAWPGPLTIGSPAAMVWFLVVATGARRLEQHLADRPGYRGYQERTSFFVPRPPHHARGPA